MNSFMCSVRCSNSPQTRLAVSVSRELDPHPGIQTCTGRWGAGWSHPPVPQPGYEPGNGAFERMPPSVVTSKKIEDLVQFSVEQMT